MTQLLDTHRHGDVTVLGDSAEVPGIGHLPVNAYVLHADQPVVVDTGLSTPDKDFVTELSKVIDPADVQWIWITHPDRDHTGGLWELLEAAPQARLVTTFIGVPGLRSWVPLRQITSPSHQPHAPARPRAVFPTEDATSMCICPSTSDPVEHGWAALANELDVRLVDEMDWPATATILQQAHDAGQQIAAATRAMVAERSLGGSPARDLRYRILASLDVTADIDESLPPAPTGQRLPGSKDARADQRCPPPTLEHQRTGPHR